MRTLSNYATDRRTSERGQQDQTNWNTFVNILSLNLVHRFPDINTMDQIPVDQIENIVRFSWACTSVVQETCNRTRQDNIEVRQRAA